MTSKVDASNTQYNYEIEFKELKLWKKIAALAFVTFATIASLGFLFEPSFQFIVGRLSNSPDSKVSKKVVKIDLTKKRVQLSSEEKEQLEKNFNEWLSNQPSMRFEDSSKRKKALKLASFYVLEKKKDDNVKFALVEILEARFKKEDELVKIANKASSPFKPRVSLPRKDPTIFKEIKEFKNEAGEILIKKKKYKRLETKGDGSCGFHALLGSEKNGVVSTDLKNRKDFCDHLEKLVDEGSPEIKDISLKNENGSVFIASEITNDKFPKMITTTLGEIFDALMDGKKPEYLSDHIKALKSHFKEKYQKEASELREKEKSFSKKNLEEINNPDRVKVLHDLNMIKNQFIADKKTRKLYLAHIRKTGVHAQVAEIIVAARYFKIPVILHRKGVPSEKYSVGEGIDPEMVDVKDEKKNAPETVKKKNNWVHIYHKGNHFEKVIKLNVKIDKKN